MIRATAVIAVIGVLAGIMYAIGPRMLGSIACAITFIAFFFLLTWGLAPTK